MKKNVVFLYPGQGSQYYQMAKYLFSENRTFRKWMFAIDDSIRFKTGRSVLDRLYDKSKSERNPFDQLLFTHPAIFMTEYSLSQVFLESGIMPDYVLGASLGEFASAAVAGIISVEQTLELLLAQADMVDAHTPVGGMTAVLDEVDAFYAIPLLRDYCEIASINYDSHFVISGEERHVQEAVRCLKRRNTAYQVLPVTHGFHSSCIEPAAPHYAPLLEKQRYRQPGIPFISGSSGTCMGNIPQRYFWDVIRLPIGFSKAIRTIEEEGDAIYIDMGPGGTLAGFAKRNLTSLSKSESYAVITPFHQELKNLEDIKRRIH